MTAPDDRAAYVAGLRELADLIESTPALPLPGITTASVHPSGGDAQACAEVDRVAEILGVAPEVRAGGEHYLASRRFGPVEYQAVAITAERMARYNAHMAGWGRPPHGTPPHQSPAAPDASAPGTAGAGAPAAPVRGSAAGDTRSTEPPATLPAGEGGTGAQEGTPATGPASGARDDAAGGPRRPGSPTRPDPQPVSPRDAGPESGGTAAPSSSSQVDGADGAPPSAGPVAKGGDAGEVTS